MTDRQTFTRTLIAERDAFARFLAVLKAESASLIKGDVEELVRIASVKTEHVEELNLLTQRRQRLLAESGFPADRVGMSEWLVVHASRDTEQLSSLWRSLLSDAAEARAMNEKNGVLIASRLRFNQAALAALQGAMRQAPLYGPDGAPDFRQDRSRDFGRA